MLLLFGMSRYSKYLEVELEQGNPPLGGRGDQIDEPQAARDLSNAPSVITLIAA